MDPASLREWEADGRRDGRRAAREGDRASRPWD